MDPSDFEIAPGHRPFQFFNGEESDLGENDFRRKGKFGIRIADYANVGNHLHLKIKITGRKEFAKFLKSVTTLIARKITGARKGKPFGRFWQGLAYTRVLMSRLEELNLKGYIEANRREAAHSVQAREEYLKTFNDWVYRERRKARGSSA